MRIHQQVRSFVVLALALFLGGIVSAADVTAENALELTLPPAIYAVPGIEMNVYFDNIVLTQEPANYHFEVQSSIGHTEERRWTVIPQPADTGPVPFSIRVSNDDGQVLAAAASVLHVIPKEAGQNRKIRLLIVGDSLTHATKYPNEVARLLSQPGNPEWTMLGTHRPSSAAEGVAHEGYGGWTWARFATRYEPNPDGTYRKRSSPFVFAGADEKPHLDVKRYIREHCDERPPDFVVFMLGINDCFSAPADDPPGIDSRIDAVFGHAGTLLTDFRRAAPNAHFGICLTPAPNSREEAFRANYKDRYSRWGWKRIQHRLVQRQIRNVLAADDNNVSIIPTQLNIDSIDGYPANNGVHPNDAGYSQLGSTIYAWLKSRL
ncbi:MAG: SGNH/GDSL hydrolase family protein [Fuerstiella sp.]|jgi:lysophospholipase L1-like esterase|nr:SGNH/GDSL hydrolase family protein [Fuerstiella sp.]MCP4513130.1 SGNH/GDSL hydrolase family protein [Fuerstiella sp.]MDG2126424.1 SGNH/GDSL hydrolase family protein [Fuerstiella sp.]